MRLLSRRALTRAALSTALLQTSALRAAADLDALLGKAALDEDALEQSRQYKELAYREAGPSADELAAAPNLPRRYRSDKSISASARRLIVMFEVSNQARYEGAYRKPTWPKGQSGVTIGIGYDLGFTNRSTMAEDWAGIIPDASIAELASACRVSGPAASHLLAFLTDIDVPWAAANSQFDRFLPYVAGETMHAFPLSDRLSPSCFGALVSLVYNRGSAMKSRQGDLLDRRKEMRAMRELIQASKLDDVPAQLRQMKRIWENDYNARGLLERRELEAQLFEDGL